MVGRTSYGFFLFLVLLALFSCTVKNPEAVSQQVEVTSGDWILVGDLILPERGGPVPAVLLLNQAAGNRTVYAGLAEELARRGIASLRLDLRGHGESTNKGTFVPGNEGRALIAPTEEDVIAAWNQLRETAGIDPERIGVVGASYSGEEMMDASREAGYVQAYVALSPGSLSEESIRSIDSTGIPWLYVTARDDRYLKEITAAVQQMSQSVEILIIPGTEHATNILQARPKIAERIAVWLSVALRSD